MDGAAVDADTEEAAEERLDALVSGVVDLRERLAGLGAEAADALAELAATSLLAPAVCPLAALPPAAILLELFFSACARRRVKSV